MAQVKKPAFPPFPALPAPAVGRFITHIYTYRLLKADAAWARLVALRPPKDRETDEAMWEALNALQSCIHEYALNAQQRGELLFCWHGSKATTIGQGGAA